MSPIIAPATVDTGVTNGKVYHLDGNWNPGFKVGLGWGLGHDGWDILAEYTWYQSSKSKGTPTLTTAHPLYDAYWFVNNPINPVVPTFESASGKWKLNFNVLDVSLGRNMYLSPRLEMRPHFGLKATWQKQVLHADFFNFAHTTDISMKNRSKNWGIGTRAGFETAWHFSREFSLVGDVAFSGVWEEFKVKRVDNTTTLATGVAVNNVSMTSHVWGLRPVLEWDLGFRWETWTCGDEWHFAIEADWESQTWFDQNQFLRLAGSAEQNGGDLSMQGLTLKFRVDF